MLWKNVQQAFLPLKFYIMSDVTLHLGTIDLLPHIPCPIKILQEDMFKNKLRRVVNVINSAIILWFHYLTPSAYTLLETNETKRHVINSMQEIHLSIAWQLLNVVGSADCMSKGSKSILKYWIVQLVRMDMNQDVCHYWNIKFLILDVE